MPVFGDRARMASPTSGTGTLTLGAAMPAFQSFAQAAIADGDQIDYLIEENGAWEIGTGTYTAAGPSLSRGLRSSSTGALLSLNGGAVVSIVLTAATMAALANPSSYVFAQAIPAALWTINHNLGRFPAVVVVDSAGTVVEGDMSYASSNTISISFAGAFAGTAYLN